MEMAASRSSPASTRTLVTADVMAETGLDDDVLRHLVHRFFGKVRADHLLGPFFAARITDGIRHQERMLAFWSSAAVMAGQYHDRPVPLHTPLPIDAAHVDRWFVLFRRTAQET